jgi:SAM-dependent methyltransferase
LLTAAGHDPDRVRSVFDFGCGTGRLLLPWWLDDPSRRLRGCDVNPDLVDWSARHLPARIEVSRSAPDPPLEGVRVPDGGFDLVQCVSVCTHLFPRGAVGDPPDPFSIAMLQDVYMASTPA